MKRNLIHNGLSLLIAMAALFCAVVPVQAQDKKPNVVILMTDDTGWGDFGCYGGGANLGHPTPNIDQVAKEGAVFTSWYGQASCTAGRASFMTGRYPNPLGPLGRGCPWRPERADEVHADDRRVLQKERLRQPTSRANGIWAINPKFYPIEHGFDEMKEFAAYYPGVYTYDDTVLVRPSVVPEIQRCILGRCIKRS